MHYLVFDVGGTEIKSALMTADAQIIERQTVETPLGSFDEFMQVIEQQYFHYQNAIQGIAFSLPGIIDADKGISVTGGFLTFNDQRAFVDDVRKRCPLPVTIQNDAKCAVLAEAWKGAIEQCDNAVVVVLGTGVGGGVLIHGELYKGANFAAGEFSFILTDRAHTKGDAYHYFGFDGSTRGLCRAVEQEKNLLPDSVDGRQVFAWVKEGDPVVTKVLDSYCYHLAMHLFSLQAIYDPEVIAIGGGISADPLLMKYIQENILYLEAHLPIHLIVPTVVRCHFMNDANLIGALRHHLKAQTAPIP